MKIPMVPTSHHKLGGTGQKTGFWLEEFAAPYDVFANPGADVTLAPPLAGQLPEVAAKSLLNTLRAGPLAEPSPGL